MQLMACQKAERGSWWVLDNTCESPSICGSWGCNGSFMALTTRLEAAAACRRTGKAAGVELPRRWFKCMQSH